MTKHLSRDEQLTLSAIDHVLRLYYSPSYFEMHAPSIQVLRDNDLIVPSTQFESGWRVTDRGKAYCEMIRNVPLPVQTTEWRDPREWRGIFDKGAILP